MLFSILSLAVVAIAPGNQIRASFFPPPPDLASLLSIAASHMLKFLKKIMFSPPNILCLFGLLGFSVLVNCDCDWKEVVPKRSSAESHTYRLLFLPLLGLALLFACFLPAAYGMSGSPPGRTLIIPVYILVCTFAATGNALGEKISRTYKELKPISYSLINAVAKIALLPFLIFITIKTADVIQAQPSFASYATNWDQVDRSIWRAKKDGHRTITVRHVSNLADLDDITSDSKHWVNQCAKNYYGITVISE
jgi:hypothetical protein